MACEPGNKWGKPIRARRARRAPSLVRRNLQRLPAEKRKAMRVELTRHADCFRPARLPKWVGCRGELGGKGYTGAIAPLRLTGLPRWGKPTLQGQVATRKNRADPPINDRQQPKLLPNRDCSPRPKLPADRSWLFLFRAFSLPRLLRLTLGFLLKHANCFSDPGQRAEKVRSGPATTGSAIISVACRQMLLAAVVLQGTAAGSLLSRRLIITKNNLSTQQRAAGIPQQPRQLLSHVA